jgi:hypothetical protein
MDVSKSGTEKKVGKIKNDKAEILVVTVTLRREFHI